MGRGDRIEALDGWRAISVALVIVSHLASHSSLSPGGVVRELLDPVGALGVRIFFVLSGFVICRGLLVESGQRGRVSVAGFYTRRAFRILPPLLLYVGAVFLLAGLGLIPAAAQRIGFGLSFTCNLNIDCGGYFGAHLWSLSVEEQFYAAFPALFVLLAGARRWTLTASALLIPALSLALLAIGHRFSSGAVSQFVCIGVGVACALNETAILAFLRRSWIAPLAAASLIPVSELVVVRHGLAPYTFALPVLIALSLTGSIGSGSVLRRPLSTPWLVRVGQVSYSIYLWQQLATYHYEGASWPFYLATVMASFVVAFASYRWVERPLVTLGARLSSRLADAPARPIAIDRDAIGAPIGHD